MRSLGVSLFAALIAASLAGWLFGWIAAIVPLVAVFVAVQYLLTRRIAARVEEQLRPIQGLLEQRRVDEADAILVGVAQRWGPWQPLLSGQIAAQRGLLRYVQLKFDDALPLLRKGTFQNWTAHAAIGCIHWRRGRKDEAIKAFTAAVSASSKEPMVYVLLGVLLYEGGSASEAAAALGKGLAAVPGNATLGRLHKVVSNKGKIDRSKLPETWLQFWPEDLHRQMLTTGRRAGPDPRMPSVPQPRMGVKNAPRR
jgi:tetratricopeptide (TPR) repeat protein